MGQRMMWVALASALVLVACNDEAPIILDAMPAPGSDMAPSPEMGPPGPDMRVADMAPAQMPDSATPGCPPPMFQNDVANYTANVAGPVYDACSLCHPAADPGPTYNLSGDPATDAAESATFVEPGCLLAPATCEIISWHPEGHPGYVAEPLLGTMVAWLEASTIVEPCDTPEPEPMIEPDMGSPPPPDDVPCEALPPADADLARSQQYRMEFEQPDAEGVSHNDILVGSCARNGTCHAIAGEGDGYYLIEGEDECATDWNFFITQIYIDLLNPPSSPLLTLPRDRRGHGGRSVFQGADDARHVRLLRWIENEVVRSR